MTLAPDRSGSNTLTVRTRFLDGSFSPSRTYTFEVSDAPVVTCSDYPENNAAGQPGQPGRFSGVATATYTPTSASSHTIGGPSRMGRPTLLSPVGCCGLSTRAGWLTPAQTWRANGGRW